MSGLRRKRSSSTKSPSGSKISRKKRSTNGIDFALDVGDDEQGGGGRRRRNDDITESSDDNDDDSIVSSNDEGGASETSSSDEEDREMMFNVKGHYIIAAHILAYQFTQLGEE